MQLDNDYSLENSEQQWTLKYSKYSTDKDGKETNSKREYFYNNLSHALNAYIDKKLKASESVSEAIQTLLNSLIELNKKGFSLNK